MTWLQRVQLLYHFWPTRPIARWLLRRRAKRVIAQRRASGLPQVTEAPCPHRWLFEEHSVPQAVFEGAWSHEYGVRGRCVLCHEWHWFLLRPTGMERR